MDLVAEFRSRRWRRLLNLIDHLPRTSFLAEAMADDEDAAEVWLQQQEAAGVDTSDRRERWSEWSAERDAVERLVDAVNTLIGVTVNVHGGKASRVRPGPRPLSAADRVKERRRLAADRSLKSRLGFGPPPAG